MESCQCIIWWKCIHVCLYFVCYPNTPSVNPLSRVLRVMVNCGFKTPLPSLCSLRVSYRPPRSLSIAPSFPYDNIYIIYVYIIIYITVMLMVRRTAGEVLPKATHCNSARQFPGGGIAQAYTVQAYIATITSRCKPSACRQPRCPCPCNLRLHCELPCRPN